MLPCAIRLKVEKYFETGGKYVEVEDLLQDLFINEDLYTEKNKMLVIYI